jgi:hypothetical protein
MGIFVIVEETDKVAGHGAVADVVELPGPNPWSTKRLFPAFQSYREAAKYLHGLEMKDFYSIRELELHS